MTTTTSLGLALIILGLVAFAYQGITYTTQKQDHRHRAAPSHGRSERDDSTSSHCRGWWWAGLAVAAALAVHQQVLIRNREPAACFRAFLNNNLFGLVVFAGLALDYLFAG